MIESSNALIRVQAALALWRLAPQTKKVIPTLTTELSGHNNNPYAIRSAADALGQMRRAAFATIGQLKKSLDTDNPYVLVGLAGAIWSIEQRADEVIPVLLRLLQDQDTDIESLIDVVGISESIGPEARSLIPQLIRLFSTVVGYRSEELRGAITAALHRIDEQGANKLIMGALVEGLQSETPGLRRACAFYLGRLGPQATEAIPMLRQALNDRVDSVRTDVIEALRSIETHQPVDKP